MGWVRAFLASALVVALVAVQACRPEDGFGRGQHPGDDDTGDDDDDDVTDIETDSGGPGQYTAIDTDVHNAAHIVHYALFWHHDDPGTTVGELRWASNGGAAWSRDEISVGGHRGAQTGVFVDGESDVHVSFFQDGEPAYARRDNTTWASAVVDPGTEVRDAPGNSSVGVDSQGGVHVGYFDGEDLYHATVVDGQGWFQERVATVGGGFGDHDLVVDSDDRLHVLFHAADDGELRHAHGTRGDWSVETVDDSGAAGRHASAALAEDGVIHVAYRDSGAGAVRHAWGVEGSWSSEIVDDEGDPGRWCTGIDIGPDGAVHLSYYAGDDGDLRHAVKSGGDWEVTIIDAAGDVGRHSSIAVDLHGEIHIAYLAWKPDDGETALKYASNLTGFWEIELIEDLADVK